MPTDWDLNKLEILVYPDPRLRKRCAPVEEFNGRLAALAAKMIEMMRAARGVGLAAPQVGVLLRMFVANTTGKPDDDRVFVNPVIVEPEGAKEASEGCLSLPDVEVQVRRALRCRVRAYDLSGRPFECAGEELPARVWQHETDHLDGVLILDRMGPADKIATRKRLRELEAEHRERLRGAKT